MDRVRIFAFATLFALSLSGASAQERREQKVRVDGTTYRVTLRGSHVSVVSKALIVQEGTELRDRYREAVQRATGCRITDELWVQHRLQGILTCGAQ